MKQLVYIPYDKSYKVTYGINGTANTERIFIKEIKTEAAGVTTTGLNDAAKALAFPDDFVETTKTIMEAFAVNVNHTLVAFEPGVSSITKNAAENTAAEILTFTVPTGTTVIDSAAGTIAVGVPFGTVVTALVATFTTSVDITSIKIGATAQVTTVTQNNFTSPKTYRVIAEHGEIKDWVVTVTVAAS